MTTDDFTEAARAKAERRSDAQAPSDAEVEAAARAICSGEGGCDPCFNWDDSAGGGCTYCTRHARAALTAARATRRDEETR